MRGTNASAESCHKGYEAYFKWRMKTEPDSFARPLKRGEASVARLPSELEPERLSDILVRLGYDRVSDRTFKNYRKNWARGRQIIDYVPINRTDYRVAPGPSDVPPEFVDRGRAA